MMYTAFKSMISSSFGFNQSLFDNDGNWAILEELYNKNFFNLQDRRQDRILKNIHQVWLGGVMSDKYRRYADTWQELNPDWEYKLWTDTDVAGMDLPNRALFDSLSNYGPKSDILRYHLMNKYGGLYIDTDFECLKSFNDLLYLDFFTGVGYPAKLELYPGLIGCVPNHLIMSKVIEDVCNIRSIPDDPTGVLETISSYFFTRTFLKVVTGYVEGVVAFPPDYFYPFPNQRGHSTRNGRDYIKDCSYAVHHWSCSWQK